MVLVKFVCSQFIKMAGKYFTYDWFDKVILVVEDEPACQLFFRTILRTTDVKLFFASRGEQALNFVKQVPKIDMVLMDIKLPGIDGIETAKKIKEIRPEIPVIIQTAYALNTEKERAMEAGCDDFLTKPIQVESLFEKMDRIFMTI